VTTHKPRIATLAAPTALLAALVAAGALAQESVTTDAGTINAEKTKRFFKEDTYSPYAGRNFPDHPLWSDQHLHTSWSPDAAGGGTEGDRIYGREDVS